MYEIKFLPEGRVERFYGSRGNYYEFEDGSRLDMHTTPVWCRRCCGEVTHGERIESTQDIDRQIADLHDPSTFAYKRCFDSLYHEMFGKGEELRQKHLEELGKRKRWRAGRSSPPRCIYCGTTDIFVFPVNRPVPNPAGPGTVEVRSIGMCSTDFNEWFFTPEGERIPRDTQPIYWRHPGLEKRPGALRRFLRRLGWLPRRESPPGPDGGGRNR